MGPVRKGARVKLVSVHAVRVKKIETGRAEHTNLAGPPFEAVSAACHCVCVVLLIVRGSTASR